MKNKQLSVRLHGESIGILEQTLTGKMIFTYDRSATQAISISMPIREEPYGEIPCETFFGGLLPESDSIRKAIGKQYGISHNNSFALLKAIGYDCAGAISFYDIKEPVTPQRFFPLTGKIVTDNELYEHIQALPKKPLFMGFEGLRLSLAGIHDKAAVCLIENKIALPKQGCATTHILKPAAPMFEGIVENEYFCLKMASHIGLPVPSVEIRHIKDVSYLLIERYDRRVQDNTVERIHQEDFCQALNIASIKKYQNEGGPSFKDCFQLLENTIQPAIDRHLLAAAMIFNFLIFNMDAHGKNFSLLHKNSSYILAPFYDIVCTRVYSHLTQKMAMKVGSQYEAGILLPRHWEQLCHDIHYAYPALKKLIKTQGETLLEMLEKQSQFLTGIICNAPIIEKIIKLLKKHILKNLRKFDR